MNILYLIMCWRTDFREFRHTNCFPTNCAVVLSCFDIVAHHVNKTTLARILVCTKCYSTYWLIFVPRSRDQVQFKCNSWMLLTVLRVNVKRRLSVMASWRHKWRRLLPPKVKRRLKKDWFYHKNAKSVLPRKTWTKFANFIEHCHISPR